MQEIYCQKMVTKNFSSHYVWWGPFLDVIIACWALWDIPIFEHMPSDGSLQVWPKTLVCQHVEDHLSAIFSYSICSFFLYLSNSFSIRQFSSSIKQSRSLINLRLIVSKVCAGLSSFRVRRVLKKRKGAWWHHFRKPQRDRQDVANQIKECNWRPKKRDCLK